jgi:hypothetical protein
MFQKLLRGAPSRSRSAKNFSAKPFAPAASVAFSALFLSCIVNIQVSVCVFNATTFGAASRPLRGFGVRVLDPLNVAVLVDGLAVFNRRQMPPPYTRLLQSTRVLT